MNNKINRYTFVNKLYKNKNIHKIEMVNNHVYLITAKDGLELYVIDSNDHIHNFYTIMKYPCEKYYYYDYINMPHESYIELYQEIERITNPKKREQICRSSYFKAII